MVEKVINKKIRESDKKLQIMSRVFLRMLDIERKELSDTIERQEVIIDTLRRLYKESVQKK